ncbi:NRDE family protein [Tepidicella baoligensis]|uniref:NRDE family protein n=1 Tax=Tepidicella baoligensis TaxID=2707016 RepID=UPI0015DAF5EC|nr:NRDE family protein [Tepidicella baoligensis]
MCLIAFALGMRADCPLLLAANRDEFWQRPTLPLSVWALPDGTRVCSGRDLRAGGTWLGISQTGRVAMLTNVRSGTPDAAPRSRGELVTHWLGGAAHMPDWLHLTRQIDPQAYGGFNLVLGDWASGTWVWLSNRPGTPTTPGSMLRLPPGWHGMLLGPGVYGLSNASLDTPWPKTLRLKTAMAKALDALTGPFAEPAPLWRETLLQALLDRHPAPDADLPETGIPSEKARELSRAFVHMPDMGYGTRSTLIARWHAPGLPVDLEEWTHAHQPRSDCRPDGERWSLADSAYRRISMSTWGMPTSS